MNGEGVGQSCSRFLLLDLKEGQELRFFKRKIVGGNGVISLVGEEHEDGLMQNLAGQAQGALDTEVLNVAEGPHQEGEEEDKTRGVRGSGGAGRSSSRRRIA